MKQKKKTLDQKKKEFRGEPGTKPTSKYSNKKTDQAHGNFSPASPFGKNRKAV